MSNDYDATCRRMVHAQPEAFLAWLIPNFATTARHDDWIDTRRIPFPGHPDQTGDLVFELIERDSANPPWALPLEFQIEPDPRMFGWLLTFLGTIVNERMPDTERGSEYQLGAIVVNLTGTSKARPASRAFVWPGKKRKRKPLVFQVWECHLAERSAKATLAAIGQGRYDRALLPWVILMAGGSEPRNRARWLDLANGEADESRRADLGYHTRIFAEKSTDPQAWLKDLEGWGMIRSSTMEATREEGRLEAERLLLLRLLRVRTRSEVPADLAAKIQQCQDSAALISWVDVAATSETLAQFRQATGL